MPLAVLKILNRQFVIQLPNNDGNEAVITRFPELKYKLCQLTLRVLLVDCTSFASGPLTGAY